MNLTDPELDKIERRNSNYQMVTRQWKCDSAEDVPVLLAEIRRLKCELKKQTEIVTRVTELYEYLKELAEDTGS